MAAVITYATTLFSSCSRSGLSSALTRSIKPLGRCLENEPVTTVGNPVCGNGIRERNEICDCGTPQVRETELLIIITKKMYAISIIYPYRSVQIAAAMPRLADWQLVPNVLEESVALTHVSSRLLEPHVGMLVGSVMWQNTAPALLQTAQMMCTFKTALRVTITKPIASPESVGLITDNVNTTLQPVSK